MNEHSSNPSLNETGLLEFALRLATYPGDSRTQNAQLLPGQLPDQLPVDIPFPEGSRVLGTLIRNPESITMYLDTHLSPNQVLTFYKQRMQAAGWQTTDVFSQPHRGGFVPSGSQNLGAGETFYLGLRGPSSTANALTDASVWIDYYNNRNRSGPVLTVNAYPSRSNVNFTDLRLDLQMNGPFPPGPPPLMRGRPSRNNFSVLPALEAPEGVIQEGGSTGGRPNGVYADTTLVTQMDLSTLAAHYKAQLQQAGCVLTEEGQNGSLAWNSWAFREDDEQWHGFLIILKVLDREYYLHMRMRSDNAGKATDS